MGSRYDEHFFRDIDPGATASAEIVVPLVLDLLPIKTVCDIGCGTGAWLTVFQLHGADILGVDGAYAQSTLRIPAKNFHAHDLRSPFTGDRRFDLAMSLEVAEHLPVSCAQPFVQSLTALAPVVLFSAAIPGQGGVNHINEQWQGYWAKLFAGHGYVAIDCLRPLIWNDERVMWWYRQNIFIYCDQKALDGYPKLAQFGTATMVSAVHPDCYDKPSGALMTLRIVFKEALMRRMGLMPSISKDFAEILHEPDTGTRQRHHL